MHLIRHVAAVLALGSTFLRCSAQVTTSCNPLDGICPNDKGLASNFYYIDFTSTKTLPSDWTVAKNTVINLGSSGAELTFKNRFDAPTVRTNFNFFFGRVEYVVKAAPGTGIISSMVLLSDDLDEVDWEFRGGVTDSVQTNYFGKGYTGTYNRSTTNAVMTPQAAFHTYAIDWSPESLVWSIDGMNVRTLSAADAGSQYPQTPMKVSLSLWDGGDPQGNPGIIQWAGGVTPLPPPQPFSMFVKSVKIWNAKPAQQYKFSDNTGSWQSIKLINNTMISNASTPAQTPAIMSSAQMSSLESHPVGSSTSGTTSLCSSTSSLSSAKPVQTTTVQPFGNTTSGTASSCSSTTSLSSAMPAQTTTAQSSMFVAPSACPSSSIRCDTASTAVSTGTLGTRPYNSTSVQTTSASFAASTTSLAVSTLYPTYPASASTVIPSEVLTDSSSPTASISPAATSAMSTCSTTPSSPAQPSSSAAASAATASLIPSAAVSTTLVSPDSSSNSTSKSMYTGDSNSLADGDSVTGILPSSMDTASNVSTTQTVFQTQTLTSLMQNTSSTTIPYPFLNGSTVAAVGSVASTGASASASGSGYAKATSSPIIYSSNGSEVRGSSFVALLATIAGTMAAMCSAL